MVQLLLLPFDLNILALVGMCVEKQHQNSCVVQLALPLPLRLSLPRFTGPLKLVSQSPDSAPLP